MTRRLLLAVAASLAAHGLLLSAAGWLPPSRAAAPGTEAIDFDLVEREAEEEEGAGPAEEPVVPAPRRAPPIAAAAAAPEPPAEAAPPAQAPAPEEPTEPAAREAPGPGAIAAADALPADVAGLPVAVAAAAVSGANTGSEGPRGGAAAVPGGAAGAPGISGAGGPAHGALLARLRSRTAGCYPRAAVRRAVEGVARVSFCVAADGAPADLRLLASSGSRLLDDAALSCVVRGAAPLPGAGACVQVPIDFHLRR